MWKWVDETNTMIGSLRTLSVARKDVSDKKRRKKIPYTNEFPNLLQQFII